MKRAPEPIYLILGPTGVGKSDFALSFADTVDGEIINCDVGQFYVPLTIGTAKPAWKQETIPHHLFDILTEPCDYTVAAYRQAVVQKIAEIRGRGKTPLIVGGSLFYAQALFFPPRNTLPCEQATSDNFYTNPAFALRSTQELWEQLAALDPERARVLHPHDRYRIERALNLWESTGVLPSSCKPVYAPVCDQWTVLYLTRERAELYERINVRTRIMLEQQGWKEEVAELDQSWHPFVRKKGLIGYGEILDALAQGTSDEELIATIQQETRHYAKRQETFWRSMARKLKNLTTASNNIIDVNLTFLDVDLYIKQLQAQLLRSNT
jgi:tRNA dimethylallyltransferase